MLAGSRSVVTGTYLAVVAVQALDDAQRLFDAHVMNLASGACRLCGTTNACPYRDAASATFARYRRLPRRRPGASRPELLDAVVSSAVSTAGRGR